MRTGLFITILLLLALSSSGEQSFLSNSVVEETYSDVFRAYTKRGYSEITRPKGKLTVVEQGIWGSKGRYSRAKDAHLACGLKVVAQKPQGDKDDSSIVQVSIKYCQVYYWDNSYFDALNDYFEQDTYEIEQNCPKMNLYLNCRPNSNQVEVRTMISL